VEWWLWFLLGLLLLAIELFTPGGFFLLFFGVAALGVGVLSATVIPSLLWVQVLLCIAFSVAGILLFRRALVARFGRGFAGAGRDVDSLVGESATALEDLPAGALGRVELRGTPWSARNGGWVRIARGQRCTVERIEGLTLWVRIGAEEYLADTRSGTLPPAAAGGTGGATGAGETAGAADERAAAPPT
jgi:membrane protein implicated in regulation of membrane protease activity